MKRSYSQKLLYKHYMYKIKLVFKMDTLTFASNDKLDRDKFAKRVPSWLNRYCKDKSRTTGAWNSRRINYIQNGKKKYKSEYEYTLLVYLKDLAAYNKVFKKYEKYVTEIMAPASADHEELIRQGSILEVRSKLYYKEYRYRIIFKRTYSIDVIDEIDNAVKNGIHNDDCTDSEDQNYYVSSTNTIYLKNNEDVMFMRLSVGHLIKNLTIVVLDTELTPAL